MYNFYPKCIIHHVLHPRKEDWCIRLKKLIDVIRGVFNSCETTKLATLFWFFIYMLSLKKWQLQCPWIYNIYIWSPHYYHIFSSILHLYLIFCHETLSLYQCLPKWRLIPFQLYVQRDVYLICFNAMNAYQTTSRYYKVVCYKLKYKLQCLEYCSVYFLFYLRFRLWTLIIKKLNGAKFNLLNITLPG